MTRPFTWDQRDVFLHLLPFGWFPTLFALAFWLLPGRRGGRVLAAGAVVALFAVLLPAGFRVMALKHRYLLQAMVPLALLAPVGLFRFLYTALPRKAAWSAAPLLTVVGAVWLHAFGPVVGEVFDEADKKDMLPIIYLVRNYVGPGDTLLDCSWSGVEVAFLPRRFHPTRVDLRHSDPYACFRWLDAPEGGEDDRWIIVFQRPQVTFPDTARLAGDSRWTKVASTGDPNTTGVTLWRWVGPASGGSVAP
jgi:hypothetical protein